ncbi:MAG: aconitate hydratase B, partial [Gammaproteobacteria bacterium]|nr:aconitate hydratase B [Gammaproteobacteria bacterium]
MIEEYRAHTRERWQQQIPPLPLNAQQTAELVELLKSPPAGEEAYILDLITNNVPPGVDEAAYVKAAFLADVAQGKASSPLIDRRKAVELLGTMAGGYNVEPLVALLDDEALAATAAAQLGKTLLMFDAFNDVAAKADAGNPHAKAVMEAWSEAEWFNDRRALPEEIKISVFKVTGETNTDDLS